MVVSDHKSPANLFSTQLTYNRAYEKKLILKDGDLVFLRPLTWNDLDKIHALFESFSEETLYLRYFTCSAQYKEKEIRRLFKALDNNELILVAELLEGEKPLIGICELARQKRAPSTAECAITVADEWHGKTLGVQMLEWLVKIGEDRKIKYIIGYFNAGNLAVSSLLRNSGYRYRTTCELNVISFHLFLGNE